MQVVGSSGQAQVAQCFVVDREETTGRTIFRSHIGDRRAVGEAQVAQSSAAELDELTDDALAAQHFRDRQHQIGRGRAWT